MVVCIPKIIGDLTFGITHVALFFSVKLSKNDRLCL